MESSVATSSDDATDVINKCFYCHKPNALLRCSRCRLTHYCNSTCQKADWKEHKKHCVSATVFSNMKNMENEYKNEDLEAILPLVDVPEEVLLDSNDGYNHDDCGICLNKITDKVTLPCHHSLCSSCLESYRSHTFDASCPFCRAEIPKDSKPYLLQNAAILVERSNRRSDPEKAQSDLAEAKTYVDRLLLRDSEMKSALMLKAWIMSKSSDKESRLEAVKIYKSIFGDYKEFIKATIKKKQEDEQVTENVNESEEDSNDYEINLTSLLNISSLCISIEKYDDAMIAIRGAMAMINAEDIRVRKILSYAADCEYHFGNYEQSMSFAHGALEMNPYFPGVYYQIARCEEAMGNLDAAIETMEKAVVMETPWDNNNKEIVTKQLIEMRNKKIAT